MSDISIGDLIAQFKDPKPEPDVSNADQWFNDFQHWLANKYEKTVHSDRKPGLHASSLGSVCARRNLIIEAFGENKVPHTAGNYFTFDVGHALHYWWQERYLGPKQELLGNWKCMACPCPNCATVLDKILRALSLAEKKEIWNECDVCLGSGRKVTYGLMPLDCECGTPWQDSICYMELPIINKELNYVGHCDGVLDHKPKKRLFEFKTISPSEYDKLKNGPKLDHVIQAHAYMGPLGLDEAIIVYENKGSQAKWSVNMFGQFVAGEPKLIPFLIKFDQSLWDGIVMRIHEHHRSVEVIESFKKQGTPLPRAEISNFERICDTKKCAMAARCAVSRECFSLD